MDGSSKSTSQDDPRPGPGAGAADLKAGSGVQGPSSPNMAGAGAVITGPRERDRVLSISDAAATKPPVTATAAVPGPAPPHREIAMPKLKPKPLMLRGNPSGSVPTTRDISHGLDAADSERAISAQQSAAKPGGDSPTPDSRNSLESHAAIANSDSELLPHDDQDIPLQILGPGVGASAGQDWQLTTLTRRFGATATPNPPPADLEAASVVPLPQQNRRGVVSQLVSQLLKLCGFAKPSHHQHNRQASASSVGGQQLGAREEIRNTVHVAPTLSRHDYIIKLCRALMLYGAPGHQLEEQLSKTARDLSIYGQFLYLPGCIIISLDDISSRTSEAKVIRAGHDDVNLGNLMDIEVDLGKLTDVHSIHKEAMNDDIGVEEGTRRLDTLMISREKFSAWFRVLIFGLTSATCAPFSFQASFIDLPLCFPLGCLVGLLQLIIAPKLNMHSSVFQVGTVFLVVFLARALGNIVSNLQPVFCFSALAQSGIVMLLPSYPILSFTLELQSHAIIPGSIRIVYTTIYSVLLGFGIYLGVVMYALIDDGGEMTCPNPIPTQYRFLFVPFFVLCTCILYQAKWRQVPVMVVVAFIGYIINCYSLVKFVDPQIPSFLGALVISVLANLHSRLWHSIAAVTIIPAILTQVPSGLASTSSLMGAMNAANVVFWQPNNSTFQESQQEINGFVFNFATSMVQIAFAISVGLFMGAFIVHPLGRRRRDLFSF
ncbi:Uncharacterized protein TOPH_01381 [Tolypocladium ophioglossoides CBS 100239]|uniref:Pheromone-regulated membrane protein 10 n=1 Tax=Tolypocladium ophioglossoides (strain CBS 100239) TaxID=1163406 RepID=A0A0L0NH63_TOLOC|nr:Uncharacterized protein TOPH_01381 [Tolypocladium ophioglossoides CBS 100239]